MAQKILIIEDDPVLGEVIAMFLPGVIYLADAVGTQTETLVVRGFALGLDFGTNSVRALIVDVGNGAEVGTAIFGDRPASASP